MVFIAISASSGAKIGPTPPGVVEAGIPALSNVTVEAIGLNGPPTDFQLLPDGRLLVAASRQFAIGDGSRWDVFSQAPDDNTLYSPKVAVAPEGELYVGVAGGFARVVWSDAEEWRLKMEGFWNDDEAGRHPMLTPALVTADTWIWHAGSGPIVAWKPGTKPAVVGQASTVGSVFPVGPDIYVSDRVDGQTLRITQTGTTIIERGGVDVDAGSTLEAICPFNDQSVLGVTLNYGLVAFDGKTRHPFSLEKTWARNLRATALCRLESGLWAAAVAGRGILIFDDDGNLRQVIPAASTPRLTKVRKLISTHGVLWAQVDDGLIAIQAPAQVTNFATLVGDMLNFAEPFRAEGALWLEVDGDLLRSEYSAEGIFQGFVSDRPAREATFAISAWNDTVLASTSKGLYVRRNHRWEPIPCPAGNLRIIREDSSRRRWLLAGNGIATWMEYRDDRFVFESYLVEGLGLVHGSATDATGITWLELGIGRLGAVTVDGDTPKVRILSASEGVPNSWAQIFVLEGVVHFNIADELFRFDREDFALVPDPTFVTQFAGVRRLIGRPTLDARGNLWISDQRGVAYWRKRNSGYERVSVAGMGNAPVFSYAIQPDGVVWMNGNGNLLRFDPGMPLPPTAPLRTVITHIDVPGAARHFVPGRDPSPVLSHDQNTLTLHFLALGSTPFESITFEVNSVLARRDWTPSGNNGFTLFNHLGPGKYRVDVRAVTAERTGEVATTEFSIAAAWYRTPLAYLAYFVFALSLGSSIAWAASYLHRRENLRLERLVRLRTSELAESNQQLERQFEENRRLTLAISQSPVGVAIVRNDGIVLFSNPRFSELYGYSLREIIGHSVSDLRIQPFSPELSPAVRRSLQAGEAWHGQLTNQTKDGHPVHVRTAISPIRAPDGAIRHYLLLQEDISEWLAEQDRRHRLETQLRQAQKLDALGTLAGGIAHDFNNILTGILGFCELAELDAEEPARVRASLAEIKSAGLRAKDLVARILTFSRHSPPTLAPMDVSVAVSEAHKLLRASTPASVEYILRLQSGIVMGDATQIHQVVVNLCTNAMHALQDRPGRITVEVTTEDLSADEAAELGDLHAGRHVRLTVADNGCGMDEKTLDRIFDPFFTTKQPGEGTGLGLAIVRGIVANHRGALRVKSHVGAGTTFDIFLPVSDRVPTLNPFSEQPELVGHGQILVVDDEEMIANFVANRLRRLGYQPLVFTEPAQALEAYRRAPTEFRGLVSDLTMPGMTGLQLLGAIREERSDMPAVIVSGYGASFMGIDPGHLKRCFLLPKPFNGEDLARALRQVLADSE